MVRTRGLTPTACRLALDAFQEGIAALHRAQEDGDPRTGEAAIAALRCCTALAPFCAWPALWMDAMTALAEAYAACLDDDPLTNARAAIACYHAVLRIFPSELVIT